MHHDDDPVWYVAYGSNLLASRFACYLAGGRPPGARHEYAGCRDTSPARESRAVRLPGRLHFAGRSRVWGGGLAFLDPDAEGEVAARAHLVSYGQFRDVAAQEARLPPGAPLHLDHGRRRWPRVLPGAYETVLHLGERDGLPQLTFSTLRDHTPRPPSAAYARTILAGLREAFGWTPAAAADYLLTAGGVAPTWTRAELAALTDPAVAPAARSGRA